MQRKSNKEKYRHAEMIHEVYSASARDRGFTSVLQNLNIETPLIVIYRMKKCTQYTKARVHKDVTKKN